MLAVLQKSVVADPVAPGPRIALVRYFLAIKDPKRAISVGQDAIGAIPSDSLVFNALGQAQRAAGDTNQAIATRRGTSLRATEALVQRTFATLGIKSDDEFNPRILAVRMWQEDKVVIK